MLTMQMDQADWNCPLCGNLNFADRDVCNILTCSAPRPGRAQSQLGDPRNWYCPSCNNENFPSRTHCHRQGCNFPRPNRAEATTVTMPHGTLGDPRNWHCPMCKNENFPSRTHCNREGCNFPRTERQEPTTIIMPSHVAQSQLGDPRNWHCPNCRNENFPTRTHCHRQGCNVPRPDADGRAFDGGRGQLGHPENWYCPSCNNENFPSRIHCNRCNFPRQDLQVENATHSLLGDPRNWRCPVCRNENFPSRTHCNRQGCNYPRPDLQSAQSQLGDPRNWHCPSCKNENFPSRTHCHREGCNFPRPLAQQQPLQMRFVPQMAPMAQMAQMAPMDVQGWICLLCNNNNYPHRMQCNNRNCRAERPQQQKMFMRPMQEMQIGFPTMASAPPVPQGMIVPAFRPGGAPSQPGDWICPSCNNHNFSSRDVCNNQTCGKQKLEVLRWVCPTCMSDNFPGRGVCHVKTCQTPKPDNPELVNNRTEILGRKRSKPGDPANWMCDACGNENFPSRTACNVPTCKQPRESGEKRLRVG